MKNHLQKVFYLLTVAIMGTAFMFVSGAQAIDSNDPGIIDPRDGKRILHTDQSIDGVLQTVTNLEYFEAEGSDSLLGNAIDKVSSPNDDMKKALDDLSKAAEKDDDMTDAATRLMDILKGTTSGKVYDGFAMLNYNLNFPGEYKTKTMRDTGETELGLDANGNPVPGDVRKIWELESSMLFYDGQIDSDTFLIRVPKEAKPTDTYRINYTIYSAGAREEFSPAVVMAEAFPYKGFDSTWVPFGGNEIVKMTVALPPLRTVRGIYTWGWRMHPPRIQFAQPIFEVEPTHNSYGNYAASLNLAGPQLDPQGLSFAVRNRGLDLAGISDAAPEKKMYNAAYAALNGASASDVHDILNDGSNGTWDEWADLAKNQRQLPPEAWDALAAEGIKDGEFGPYRMVSVYMNNEMYADGPAGPGNIHGWAQGDQFDVKVLNMDNHSHYYRLVDFGTRLHDDIANCCQAGGHSFEIFNFKPAYGAPKVAEMQWRAGWGFRPHHDAHPQPDVFPRASDREQLLPYTNGAGVPFSGFQFMDAATNPFTFNPPPFIVGNNANPIPKLNGGHGLTIGQTTEGWGVANICATADIPQPGPPFCPNIRDLHPTNAANFPPFAGFPKPTMVNGHPTFPETTHVALRFPPFLRNPNQAGGGDIIPPTPLWKPFLWLNPHRGDNEGTLLAADGSYWADQTYSHGAPISAGASLTAHLEQPRASGQVFYQFDDLYHDNAIFSPHPTFEGK